MDQIYTRENYKGGVKMINVFNFEKALKLNWIRKVIHQTEASWKLLLLDSGYKLSNITLMGGSFPFKPQAPRNDFCKLFLNIGKISPKRIDQSVMKIFHSLLYGTTTNCQNTPFSWSLGTTKEYSLWEISFTRMGP